VDDLGVPGLAALAVCEKIFVEDFLDHGAVRQQHIFVETRLD
jgi:hypothetical protein